MRTRTVEGIVKMYEELIDRHTGWSYTGLSKTFRIIMVK